MPFPRFRLRTLIAATSAAALGAVGAIAIHTGADAAPGVQRLSLLPTSGLVADLGCATPRSRHAATCFGKVQALLGKDGILSPRATAAPTGYGPADLISAYALAGTNGGGRTVAIVDAFDDPKAEADLGVYRSHFGLPACTTANGCFHKVNQSGQASPLPKADYGWAEEISLDLDMVSAICPTCHIVLVEANSADVNDLVKAENAAAAYPGVVAISNSFGAAEDNTITTLDKAFNHPGIAITASSGDSGYGVSWPASSPYVTGVGGTTLTKTTGGRGWAESVWRGAGSGCSAYEPKPSWQGGASCAKRTVADVSAVADPNTGVAVYDTANSCAGSLLCGTLLSLGAAKGAQGWIQIGGTSVSAPIIASVYALAGNTASIGPSYPYSHTSGLYDVTTGSNGSCGGTYLCTGKVGYDGPTGLGTPKGTSAF